MNLFRLQKTPLESLTLLIALLLAGDSDFKDVIYNFFLLSCMTVPTTLLLK